MAIPFLLTVFAYCISALKVMVSLMRPFVRNIISLEDFATEFFEGNRESIFDGIDNFHAGKVFRITGDHFEIVGQSGCGDETVAHG